MAGISARRVVVALDCPDARELAEFYASMLGWRIHDGGNPDWLDVLPPEGESGALALAVSEPQLPTEVFSLGEAGLERRSHVNDELLAGLRLGAVEEIRFASADGTPIEAFVVRPPGSSPVPRLS